MQALTYAAIYFIFWWITLFAMLPIGLRTQDDDNNIINGTVRSAPAKFRFWRMFLITTLVSGVVFAVWYYLTAVLGLSADSIPRIVPNG